MGANGDCQHRDCLQVSRSPDDMGGGDIEHLDPLDSLHDRRLGFAERSSCEDGPADRTSQPSIPGPDQLHHLPDRCDRDVNCHSRGIPDNSVLDRKQDAHDVDAAQVADHRHHFRREPFVHDPILHKSAGKPEPMENGTGKRDVPGQV